MGSPLYRSGMKMFPAGPKSAPSCSRGLNGLFIPFGRRGLPRHRCAQARPGGRGRGSRRGPFPAAPPACAAPPAPGPGQCRARGRGSAGAGAGARSVPGPGQGQGPPAGLRCPGCPRPSGGKGASAGKSGCRGGAGPRERPGAGRARGVPDPRHLGGPGAGARRLHRCWTGRRCFCLALTPPASLCQQPALLGTEPCLDG